MKHARSSIITKHSTLTIMGIQGSENGDPVAGKSQTQRSNFQGLLKIPPPPLVIIRDAIVVLSFTQDDDCVARVHTKK